MLAKSTNLERIRANLEIVDLDDDDMKLLAEYSEDLKQKGQLQRFVYPPFNVDFGFPDKS